MSGQDVEPVRISRRRFDERMQHTNQRTSLRHDLSFMSLNLIGHGREFLSKQVAGGVPDLSLGRVGCALGVRQIGAELGIGRPKFCDELLSMPALFATADQIGGLSGVGRDTIPDSGGPTPTECGRDAIQTGQCGFRVGEGGFAPCTGSPARTTALRASARAARAAA